MYLHSCSQTLEATTGMSFAGQTIFIKGWEMPGSVFPSGEKSQGGMKAGWFISGGKRCHLPPPWLFRQKEKRWCQGTNRTLAAVSMLVLHSPRKAWVKYLTSQCPLGRRNYVDMKYSNLSLFGQRT
jgi:hypothetical protein